MLKYYIGDILFCECAPGSLMDISIRAMQKEEYTKRNKKIYQSIFDRLPIVIPEEKAHKDILKVVKEG